MGNLGGGMTFAPAGEIGGRLGKVGWKVGGGWVDADGICALDGYGPCGWTTVVGLN